MKVLNITPFTKPNVTFKGLNNVAAVAGAEDVNSNAATYPLCTNGTLMPHISFSCFTTTAAGVVLANAQQIQDLQTAFNISEEKMVQNQDGTTSKLQKGNGFFGGTCTKTVTYGQNGKILKIENTFEDNFKPLAPWVSHTNNSYHNVIDYEYGENGSITARTEKHLKQGILIETNNFSKTQYAPNGKPISQEANSFGLNTTKTFDPESGHLLKEILKDEEGNILKTTEFNKKYYYSMLDK